jgi:hypothetical protein
MIEQIIRAAKIDSRRIQQRAAMSCDRVCRLMYFQSGYASRQKQRDTQKIAASKRAASPRLALFRPVSLTLA